MQDLSVKQLGEHSFLVGTAVDDGQAGNWAKGRNVWMPVDDAAQIVEFDTLEEINKARAKGQAAERPQLGMAR